MAIRHVKTTPCQVTRCMRLTDDKAEYDMLGDGADEDAEREGGEGREDQDEAVREEV